jgi:hypothetical protein
LALELTVVYLAFGESTSQLRLVHGFEDEDEDEFEDDF